MDKMDKKWLGRGGRASLKEVFERNIGASLDEVSAWRDRFLNGGYLISGLEEAVELALRFKDKPVTVVGDYDADGVTATSVLRLALTRAGFKDLRFRIPKRFSEGYGLNPAIIDEIESGLLITVDNGIAALESMRLAKEKGLTVVILDHHMAPNIDGKETFPEADVIIDPEAGTTASFDGYCGAGLAYRFALKLLGKDFDAELCTLAAIGTVCDVVPLRQENYWLVREGLSHILDKGSCPPGLYELVKKLKLSGRVSADDVGFRIGPCINAYSRMADDGAAEALALLSAVPGEYPESTLQQMAADAIKVNESRKEAKASAYEEAERLISAEKMESDFPIVLLIPGIGLGIIGLIAGNIAEKYGVPAIVFTEDAKGVLKGSARTACGYNVKASLDEVSGLLLGYGGHPGAAGLSIVPENLDQLRRALNENARRRGFAKEQQDTVEYDLEVKEEDAERYALELEDYSPFGEGNPKPVFLVRGFQTTPSGGKFRKVTVGKSATVTRFWSRDCSAVGYDDPERFEFIQGPVRLDLVGTLSMEYLPACPGGRCAIEVSELKPAQSKSVVTPMAAMLAARARKF